MKVHVSVKKTMTTEHEVVMNIPDFNGLPEDENDFIKGAVEEVFNCNAELRMLAFKHEIGGGVKCFRPMLRSSRWKMVATGRTR